MLKEAVFSSLITVVTDQSLNPYFNGTCSKSLQTASAYLFALGLSPYFNEHAQREGYNWTWSPDFKCLNPYFNGTCSKSSITR